MASEEGTVVRRLYYYVVAAVGLALLGSAVDIIGALLDALSGSIWVEPLATGKPARRRCAGAGVALACGA